MRQTEYLEGVLAYYKANDIIQGDPNEGKWEEAHTPLPRSIGDDTVLLLHEHHIIHDLWQSIELNKKHYVTYHANEALYGPGLFCANWFELCDEHQHLTFEACSKIGKDNAARKVGVSGRSPEEMKAQGLKNKEAGLGVFAFTKEERIRNAQKAGKIAASRGVGVHSLTTEQLQTNGKKAGTASAASPKAGHKQLWQSLIDPALIGSPATLSRLHRIRGWDPNARVYIGQKSS